MKTLNITFTDEEYRRMKKAKKEFMEKHRGNTTWHGFLLNKCCKKTSLKRKYKK